MKTQKTLYVIILSCLFCLFFIALMSFYKSPYNPNAIDKIIGSLNDIIIVACGAKAGMSVPSPDLDTKPGQTDVLAYSSNKDSEEKK